MKMNKLLFWKWMLFTLLICITMGSCRKTFDPYYWFDVSTDGKKERLNSAGVLISYNKKQMTIGATFVSSYYRGIDISIKDSTGVKPGVYYLSNYHRVNHNANANTTYEELAFYDNYGNVGQYYVYVNKHKRYFYLTDSLNTGSLTITQIDGNTVSGSFNFKPVDGLSTANIVGSFTDTKPHYR